MFAMSASSFVGARPALARCERRPCVPGRARLLSDRSRMPAPTRRKSLTAAPLAAPSLRRNAPASSNGRRQAVVVAATKVTRNPNMAKLQAGYLFPEINRIKNAHLAENPDAKIILLGIGDTTEPIPAPIVKGMVDSAEGLGTLDGYGKFGGYGSEAGQGLREKLVERFYAATTSITSDELFVSDGSKCDISRLQMMFGSGATSPCKIPPIPRTSTLPS